MQTRGSAPAREDAFGYNDRSEVTSATLGTDTYGYSFDNIGNRITAEELTDEIAYTSNDLNQYTAIEKNSSTPFVPTFDADGNQLTVQTATGVWTVTYNAENRPITFTKDTTVIECKYDASGRRFEKKVTDNNVITFWQRYVYKGFLQIAAFHVTLDGSTEVYTLATTTYWDATEPIATRPLAFKDHTQATPVMYFYTHDLTKNVCEILSRDGSTVSIVTEYDYTPFGAVSASNSATPNTFMFSSEVLDPETSLVYYNFRHYNPTDGRWISRDPIEENGGWNCLAFCRNSIANLIDWLGWDECIVVLPTEKERAKLDELEKFAVQYWKDNKGKYTLIYAKDIADARIQLEKISQQSPISELIFAGHGTVALQFIGSMHAENAEQLGALDVDKFYKDIKFSPDAHILYEGCKTACLIGTTNVAQATANATGKETTAILDETEYEKRYSLWGVSYLRTLGTQITFSKNDEKRAVAEVKEKLKKIEKRKKSNKGG